MKLDEYYHNLYRLTYITRYDTVPRSKAENVCEHSFLVSAIVLKLHDEYFFNLGIALQISTAHDILECETGDVGHIIKKAHPSLYNVLKDVEKSALEKYPIAVRDGIALYDKNDTNESKIVHLADSIQVQQYAENEVRLGNSWYFEEVVESSKKRVIKIREELENIKK